MALVVKTPPANASEMQAQSLGQEDSPGTHSSILAWRIPWTKSLAGNAPYGCKESDMPEAIEYSSTEVKCLLFGLYFPVDFISFTFMSD